MNRNLSRTLLTSVVVLASGLLLAGCGEQPTTNPNVVDTTGTKPTTTTDTTTKPTTTDTTTKPSTDTTTTTTTPTTTTPSTTDFSKYSTSKQSVDEDSTEKYTIESIIDSAEKDYYMINFMLPEGANGVVKPKATAEYRSDLGAIRVTLYNVENDKSGIAFLKSRDVNKAGVQKIFHQVSGTEGVAIYDIGVTSSTPYLFEWSAAQNSEFLSLKIKNIAASTSTTTTPTLDLGSKVFSKTKQSIVGATTAESAASSGYSYNSSANVASIVFNVAGSADKPIPSCSAEYTNGALELTFSDIKDVFGGNRTLDGGAAGSISLTRTGNVSVYRFTGITDKEFQLSASTNPNQVVLDIKLK